MSWLKKNQKQRKTFTIRLTPVLKNRFQEYCEMNHIVASDYLRDCIAGALEDNKGGSQAPKNRFRDELVDITETNNDINLCSNSEPDTSRYEEMN